jgi:hypothetical protein
MRLVFIYGPVASGKLTIARDLSVLTGLSVFHNHLIVDAVTAIFPFGTDEFVRLREELWLTLIREAAEANVSLIFTFAPEPTVSEGFPSRVRDIVESAGGDVSFVRLTVPEAAQEERLGAADRSQFGKLRSVDVLRRKREQFRACEAKMPTAVVTIDTGRTPSISAAREIAEVLKLPRTDRVQGERES